MADDVPMPTAENAPPMRFEPGQGTGILDVLEIALMTFFQISGGPTVAPGALRHQMMTAERVAQLSPEAQRWMKPIIPTPEGTN